MTLRFGSPEEVGMSSEGIKRAENAAQRLVDIGNTPSIVTLIARRGVVVSYKAFGTNGTELDSKPLSTDAIFPACSITKIVTATGIMMLVEEGMIGLNRPVTDYIPELVGEGKDGICIHHLLTHTSGLCDDVVYEHIDKKKGTVEITPCAENQNQKIHELMYLSYDAPMSEKPGRVMSYFNHGYVMLGEIIRRVSGKSYKEFMKERIFEPLGMKDSSIGLSDDKVPHAVKRGADAMFGKWLTSESNYRNEAAGSSLFTTVMDIAILARMYQNKGIYNGIRLLSPVTVELMTKNHIPGITSEYRNEIFPEASWGYGWGINGPKKDGGDLFSPQAYSHWGAAGVFVCVDPTYETIQVYFSVEIDHNKECRNIYADSFNNAALAAIVEL